MEGKEFNTDGEEILNGGGLIEYISGGGDDEDESKAKRAIMLFLLLCFSGLCCLFACMAFVPVPTVP